MTACSGSITPAHFGTDEFTCDQDGTVRNCSTGSRVCFADAGSCGFCSSVSSGSCERDRGACGTPCGVVEVVCVFFGTEDCNVSNLCKLSFVCGVKHVETHRGDGACPCGTFVHVEGLFAPFIVVTVVEALPVAGFGPCNGIGGEVDGGGPVGNTGLIVLYANKAVFSREIAEVGELEIGVAVENVCGKAGIFSVIGSGNAVRGERYGTVFVVEGGVIRVCEVPYYNRVRCGNGDRKSCGQNRCAETR